MRRHALALLALCAVMLLAAGCDPGTVGVTMRDDFFSPATATADRGATVRWTNEGFNGHTSTGNAPLNLWSSGRVGRGNSFDTELVAAGTYAYRCTIHFGMNGSVKVPLAVSPVSGSTSTTFTVTVASEAAPSGFQYVVQKQDPGGAFQAFRTITTTSTTFRPTQPGTYRFRAQLKRTSTSAASGFSDPKSISVS